METVHEVAIYAEQCVMKGTVCHQPERKYGEDWRESADLRVFKGTEAELVEYFEGTTGFLAKCGRAVLQHIGYRAPEESTDE